MPKTMREQLEESFEKAEEETGRSEEDTEESIGATEEEEPEESGGDSDVVDESSEREIDDSDEDDEPVAAEADDEGDEEPSDPPLEKQTKAPVSWKPGVREHWKKLPPDVQQEVLRRESEIQKGLQQASQHRKVADEYLRTIQPYQNLMQSMGATPSQAISTVMGTVAQLSQGNVKQKAEIVASLIKDYGVDIESLDNLLSGQDLSDDPNAPLLSQLDERLRPINEFMGQMQGVEQQQDQQINAKASQDLQQFVGDPKNEFLEDVRETMADYLEVAARNQRTMTLQEAYNRACNDSPEIKKILDQREGAMRQQPTGDDIARKRRAASSVSGNPNGSTAGLEEKSLRDAIASQFEDNTGV